MIRYLLDTDHWSLIQRRNPAVLETLNRVGREQVAISVITAEEQLRGWLNLVRRYSQGTPRKLAWAYASFDQAIEQLQMYERLGFSEGAGECFLELRNQKVRIGTQDLRIACIALTRSLTVVTRNRRDFEQVPGLEIEDWSLSVVE